MFFHICQILLDRNIGQNFVLINHYLCRSAFIIFKKYSFSIPIFKKLTNPSREFA